MPIPMRVRQGRAPDKATPAGSSFRPDIQGLRGVAVGIVVLDHAHLAALTGGYVGVDVFFVISGFLITGLLIKDAARNSQVGFRDFYARRAKRILPAATVVIVATTIASNHYLNFVRARAVRTDSIWAALFAANIDFARQGTNYFTQNLPPSPLQHFWSLAVEEQFYLVWPALLAVVLFGVHAARRGRGAHSGQGQPGRLLLWRPLVALVAIGAGSLYLSVHQTASDPTVAYFSTLTRAWELAAGALLAILLPIVPRGPDWVRVMVGWSGLTAIAVASFIYNASTPFPGDAALLPVLGACAVIAAGDGTPPRLGVQQVLARRPMRFLGDISYSLYLWHWPILVVAAGYVGHTLSAAQDLLLVALAVVISTASYYFVENPFRYSKRVFGPRPQQGLLLWPVAVTSVIVVWAAVYPVAPRSTVADATATAALTNNAVLAVKEAVVAAQEGAPIPTDLSPSYARMTHDSVDLGDCVAWHKISSKICTFGDPTGSKRMVVLGNSHSEMWLAALRPIAAAAHWQLVPIIKESCDYINYVQNDPKSQCHVWYEWALNTIRTLHPDMIVVGTYEHSDWQDAIRQILSDVSAPGRRVVLFSDAPAVKETAQTCLLSQGATLKTCLFPEEPQFVQADQQAKAIAAQAKVDFVDVDPWLCYDQECPSVIDSKVPYIDAWHLTNTYVRYLIPELTPRLHLTT